jgi:hypothetical protein
MFTTPHRGQEAYEHEKEKVSIISYRFRLFGGACCLHLQGLADQEA